MMAEKKPTDKGERGGHGGSATKRQHVTSATFAFNHERIAPTDFTIFIKDRN